METHDCSQNETLISLFREGNKELLDIIYGKFRDTFVSFAVFKLTSQEEEAKDAYHDAVMKIYLMLQRKIDFRMEHLLETYIFKVAENILKQNNKRKYRLEKLEIILNDIISDKISSEDPEENAVVNRFVQRLLNKLSPTDRTIIELRYFQKLNWTAISKKMNLKIGYLRKRKHDILCKLKKLGCVYLPDY